MYSPEEIATEINDLKPDFNRFLNTLLDKSTDYIVKDISSTQNNSEKIFKAEIAILYYSTHQHHYSYNIKQKLNSFLITNKSYSITDSFEDYHISYYVKNIKNYIPKYLWNKVRPKTTKEIKTLKDDAFSLAAFTSYITNLKKPLTSKEIIIYIKQIILFSNQKQAYLEVLLSNCKGPSLELQKILINSRIINSISNNTKSKIMYLNRWHIQNLYYKYKLPAPYSIFDTRDSDFKPFITGLNRKPTTDLQNMSYLVYSVFLLQYEVSKQPNEVYSYFIEELKKHLSLPEYKEPLEKYLKSIKEFELIKGF